METTAQILIRVKDEVARESEDYNNWFEVIQAKEQYLFVDQVALRFHEEMQKQIKQQIQDRINLYPNVDDLPLSQRGALDAYLNCRNILSKPLQQ